MNPRTLAIVILVVVGVAVAVVLVLRGGDDTFGVQDGPADVGFEVLDSGCGYQNVVTAQGTIPPREGEFCLIRVTVTNRGGGPVRLDPSCQLLVSTSGQRFGPRADVLVQDQASTRAFGTPLGAGQVVEDAALYYDVPVGTQPGTAELHAECAGRATTVDL